MPDLTGYTPEIRTQIYAGEPVLWHGLLIYPVLMRDYELFTASRISITAMQSKLPMPYAAMPYLTALFALSMDGIGTQSVEASLFQRLILLLSLVLRLQDEEGETTDHFRFKTKAETKRLTELVVIAQGKIVSITPKDFTQLRKLIADMNRIELPNESQNPDLIDAEQDYFEAHQNELEYDFDSLMYSVGLICGKTMKEMYSMTVRDFFGYDNASDRLINHIIYSLLEKSGFVKFKGGNPFPSWKFDKRKGLSPALISKESFEQKFRGVSQ